MTNREVRRYYDVKKPKSPPLSSIATTSNNVGKKVEDSEDHGKHEDVVEKNVPGSVLRETYWTTPNIITMSRIACSPVLSWLILQGRYEHAVAGMCAFLFPFSTLEVLASFLLSVPS
jgi:hypothetical protein